jgi:hypothetical protein
MKFRSHSLLFVLLTMTALAFADGYGLMTDSLNASGHDRKTRSINGATEAIHLTSADQGKSIGQLIREQDPAGWERLPDQAISGLHFFVDPFNDALILPRVEAFMPPGFQWGILPGQDKRLFVPENPLSARDGLDLFLVQTKGTCNFLLIVEFYPKNNR